ncbi:MAG: hypothetical protein CME19_00760 [Gemmatimonadetes bacterium]|nr:hypothetical protein [Gemmatimonadota bacterium]
MTIDGKQYGHLIDPRSGQQVNSPPSVTILSRRGVDVDALSTSCSVMGVDPCWALVEDTPDTEANCVWFEDETLKVTHSDGVILLDPQNVRCGNAPCCLF